MPSSAITFEDVKQLTLTSSSLSRTFIIDAMELAYYGSATAQKLMDDWAATGKNILVGYDADKFEAAGGTGGIIIDPAYVANATYISPTGKGVAAPFVLMLMHELAHALDLNNPSRVDNTTDVDYAGDTVRFVNDIHRELGYPERLSYYALDFPGTYIVEGKDYTDGTRKKGTHLFLT